ncbi:MAG TPA: triose-phosphate isomerase, partial [Acidimicrobiales bacterium]|nr:triose-phosphate isomerase [Acidimicrobiales bacterium]
DRSRPLVSGNWKMHHSHFEAIQVAQKLGYRLSPGELSAAEVSLHPPFTALRSVQTVLESDETPIAVGAQHCHWEDEGAYTGEISAAMLAKLSVRYVIAGHSERRQLFGDTDEKVNRRVQAILRHRMTPILCVGETLEEREAGHAAAVVDRQVRAGLAGLGPATVGGLVFAYEPVWAIGTGHTATPEDAQETCSAIRAVVAEVAGGDAAGQVRIQYGGSVSSGNAGELMARPDVDGLLVGGSSLDADTFAAVVKAALTG